MARTRGTERYIVVEFEDRYGGWSITRGTGKDRFRFWTGVKRKRDVIPRARRIAKSELAELVVKARSGRIVDRISYGHDAKHRPG